MAASAALGDVSDVDVVDVVLLAAGVAAVPRARIASTPRPRRAMPRWKGYRCAPMPRPNARFGTMVVEATTGEKPVPPGAPDITPRTSMTYGPGEDAGGDDGCAK